MTTTDFTQLRAQLDAERDRVDVASHDFSVRELIRMLREEELNIAPEYQRKFRWTEDTESIFIESVFLGLPVPPIFVASNEDFAGRSSMGCSDFPRSSISSMTTRRTSR